MINYFESYSYDCYPCEAAFIDYQEHTSEMFFIDNILTFDKCDEDILKSSRKYLKIKRWISGTFINSTIKRFLSFSPFSLVVWSCQLVRSVALVRLVLYFRNGSWILVAYNSSARGSLMRDSLAICLLQYSCRLGREPRYRKRQRKKEGERKRSRSRWIRTPCLNMMLFLIVKRKFRFERIDVTMHIFNHLTSL